MKFKMKITARNIVNPEIINEFISKVSKNQSDKIKTWCNSILKNYLKNEYDNLKEVTKAKKTDPTWLQEAVKRKDAQMLVIDKEFEMLLIEHIFHYFDTLEGKIKHTFSEAVKQTKGWENKENIFNIKLTKGVKEILKCDNGFTWFEIMDEETLYNEGEVLQNCMRKKEHGPEYWKQIQSKTIKIFTLRDNKGIGHVGVEYDIKTNSIEQMLGKQNDDPIEIYHPFCIELIKYLKCIIFRKTEKFLNIIFINKNYYNIFNLPNNLKVEGNLDLRRTNIIKLPKNLIITGNLDLSNSKIIYLPTDLKVDGYLDLYNTLITELPNNMTIGGDLNLMKSKITKLPKNLHVGKNLNLSYTNIIELPKDLKVDKIILVSKNMKLICDNKELLEKIKIF